MVITFVLRTKGRGFNPLRFYPFLLLLLADRAVRALRTCPPAGDTHQLAFTAFHLAIGPSGGVGRCVTLRRSSVVSTTPPPPTFHPSFFISCLL